ncbi:HlyD family secretion protein [Salmonella enterica subsp. enterica]|uniref:HlyD family secretion protein n=1 Tax=Salmonella enterica I TaxID=59201 RepID=A0A447U6Z5_SALET|nr:HlyD family secretion protein [Salmonella enterica subsp. enterica]
MKKKAELIYQTVTCHIDLILHGLTQKESGLMKKPVVIGLAIAAIVAVIAGGTWWYQSRQDDGLTLYGNVDIRTVNISFRVGGRLASLNVG